MSLKSAIRYGVRGLVAAARGAAEGQVAAAQAQDARTARQQQFNLQSRLADLEEQKLWTEDAFKRTELGEEGRRSDEQEKTKRMNIRVTTDGKLVEIDEDNKTARYLGKLEAETKETVANIGAKATTDAATIKADADKTVATTVTEGKAAEGAADRAMSYDIELLRAQTQNYSDDIKRDIAEQGIVSAEKISQWTLANEAYKAELDAQGKSGGARGTVELGLNDDQIKRVDALVADYIKEDDYKALQKLQREFFRANNAYDRVKKAALDPKNEDAFKTGSADIALINIFQRFIDPGVSVREGDVELLQKGESIWNEIKVKYFDRIKETGYRLTPEAREEMFALVEDFYSTAMVELSKPLSERYQARIDLDGQLRDSGVKVSNLGTDFWEDYGSVVERQTKPPMTDNGDGDPDTPSIPPEETPTEPTSPEGAARWGEPGSARRNAVIENAVKQAIEQGMTAAEFQESLLEKGADEDAIARALTRFAELQDAETPQNVRSRQDFRNRGVKEDDNADE